MVGFAAVVEICLAHHSSTYRRIGSKFHCIRPPRIARLSSREKFFECFAKTGANTIVGFKRREKAVRKLQQRLFQTGLQKAG